MEVLVPQVLTMEVINELSHFNIFLHMDVFENFNFNRTKAKTTLSRMHGIHCGEN